MSPIYLAKSEQFGNIDSVEDGICASRVSSQELAGLSSAYMKLGMKPVIFSENWAPAAAVLAERFPQVPNFGDVRQIKSLPKIDILTAGFPCQDLSQAGRTEGISGAKSGPRGSRFPFDRSRATQLGPAGKRSFMLRLDGGSAMTRLASALEERGYRWAYRVSIRYLFFRSDVKRVFLLASPKRGPRRRPLCGRS